jgi:hypothetical protein
MKFIYIAAVLSAALISWGIIYVRKEPPRKVYATLQERWGDTPSNVIVSPPKINTVRTIAITREPVEVKEVALPPQEVEPPIQDVVKPHRRTRYRPTRSGICSVHGMRKVYVGKYRWRCRR